MILVFYQILGTDFISNILVSSEGITILQKSLFSHFLCDSSLFFVLKELIRFKKKKITVVF